MKVAYITTRESSYSRVSIIHEALAARFPVFAILSDGKSYLVRLLSVTLRFLFARVTGRFSDVDVVFVGFLAQPILPLIRLFWRGPLVADAYFSLYDTMIHDKQKAAPGSLLARLCFWLDRFMLHHVDLCFTDTACHIQYFKQKFDTPHANVKRLWVSADHGDVQPAELSTPFQVFFWGGFIPLQGIDVIIRAADLLQNEDVHFTIVGRGQTYPRCRQLADELNTRNITFIDWLTLGEIAEFAQKSHLALGIFGTTEKAGRVIPNKVFQSLALGIPLITGESEAIGELLCDDHDVLLVPRGDEAALAEKIRWVRAHYEEAMEIGRRGCDTFSRVASPACIEAILHSELNGIARRSARQVTKSAPVRGKETETQTVANYLFRNFAKSRSNND